MSKYQIAEAIAPYLVELNRTHLAETMASYTTANRANAELESITGIARFFQNEKEFQAFQSILATLFEKADAAQAREFGDFQTPFDLARRVCQYLAETGISPSVIIEPTYGMGNFILAALEQFPQVKLVYGVELQARYEWHLKIALLSRALRGNRGQTKIVLHRDSIFTHTFAPDVIQTDNLLILGNPPWVTNAALGLLESENLPRKQNIKALTGLDALTGKSNFDVGEFILLRLLDRFAARTGTLAMLVKNATARNIVEILPAKKYPLAKLQTLEFDAAREFNVAVDANLFVAQMGARRSEKICHVASLAQPTRITREFGWVNDKFVSNVRAYQTNADLDGKSLFVWRQGLKHDCARVMELEQRGHALFNGAQAPVQVEQEYVYGLVKSSDLQTFEATPHKQVIVTQKRLGEETSILRHAAPQLWQYLIEHGAELDGRKSSIYRDKPRFSIFGIGDYSFAPYKVAISGLYKEPNFSLVCPFDNRPVLVDDTCYMLGFDSYVDALLTATLYNSARVKQFLRSIVFSDAKRPFTKQVLMRVEISRIIADISFDAMETYWREICYTPRVVVVEPDFQDYKNRVLNQTLEHKERQLALSL